MIYSTTKCMLSLAYHLGGRVASKGSVLQLPPIVHIVQSYICDVLTVFLECSVLFAMPELQYCVKEYCEFGMSRAH